MSEIALASVISRTPKLHPFTGAMAEYLKEAACLLVEKYDGDARRVWKAPLQLSELRRRLLEFPGIGPHLSTVGIFLLQAEQGIKLMDVDGFVDIRSACPRLHFDYFGL